MRLYKRDLRHTPWSRWHILLALIWSQAFIVTIGWLLYGVLGVLIESDLHSLVFLTGGVFAFIMLMSVLQPLRKHCYFQEIFDDLDTYGPSAYSFKQDYQEDQAACVLMEQIENPNITPASRQDRRQKLKALIHAGCLSANAVEQVRIRHNYLL